MIALMQTGFDRLVIEPPVVHVSSQQPSSTAAHHDPSSLIRHNTSTNHDQRYQHHQHGRPKPLWCTEKKLKEDHRPQLRPGSGWTSLKSISVLMLIATILPSDRVGRFALYIQALARVAQVIAEHTGNLGQLCHPSSVTTCSLYHCFKDCAMPRFVPIQLCDSARVFPLASGSGLVMFGLEALEA